MTETETRPDPRTLVADWLREHGFTQDRTGWQIRNHVRVTQPAPGKINVYVYVRATGETWTANLDHPPLRVLRALLVASGLEVKP